MAQFEVYFDTNFPSENSRNLHLLHKNNAIVNFNKILLNINIQKGIICIFNNDIAAARVELWSSSTNTKYAESSSTNYILCKKQIKVEMSFL